MPRPFCFLLPYPRFSPAHVLGSLEEAVSQFEGARVSRAVIDAAEAAPQSLDADIEIDGAPSGALSVRFDGESVALVLEPQGMGEALPGLLAIAEVMLGSIRDLAAVAAGQESEDEDEIDDPDAPPASFDALAARARRMFSLDARAEGAFGITIAWQKPVGRTQGVLVTTHTPRFEEDESGAAAWITLESPVCPRDRLTPEEALRRSRSFDVGALCARPQHYTLVARYPLRAMTRARFVTITMALAEEADRLEAMLTGGKDAY